MDEKNGKKKQFDTDQEPKLELRVSVPADNQMFPKNAETNLTKPKWVYYMKENSAAVLEKEKKKVFR